jgi:hypothetical protein
MHGLAKEAQDPLFDIFMTYTGYLKCLLSEGTRVPMISFEDLVGAQLVRKLASRLFRDYALWWRDEGEHVQGLLQDLEQMADIYGAAEWLGMECVDL